LFPFLQPENRKARLRVRPGLFFTLYFYRSWFGEIVGQGEPAFGFELPHTSEIGLVRATLP
jgi:hypothetical protein